MIALVVVAALMLVPFVHNLSIKARANSALVRSLKHYMPMLRVSSNEGWEGCASTLPSRGFQSHSGPISRSSQVPPCLFVDAARLSCLAGDAHGASTLVDLGLHCDRRDLLQMVSGDIAYALGDFELAVYEWSTAPSRESLLLNRARVLLQSGLGDQAEVLLRLLVAAEDALTRDTAQAVYDALGRLAREQRDPEKIISAYSEAFRFAPERADYLVWIGIAQRELGNLLGSRSSLEQALDVADPEQCDSISWVRAQYGLTVEAMGDSRRALGTLRDALDFAQGSGTCSTERLAWLRRHVERLEALGNQ
jgi:tetratricopeptide (TPR) repeat protein